MSTLERSHKLPHGFTATFRWDSDAPGLEVAWSPTPPRIRKRKSWRTFREAYNQARRQFFTEVAVIHGGNILILDTDGAMESIEKPVLQ